MAGTFRALVVDKAEKGTSASIRELTDADLMPGDVDVRVAYSTVNYKDGLAVTGAAPVVRKTPLIAGIDLAGTVTASRNPLFKKDDAVLVNGWGLGETHHGGYGGHARLEAKWLTRIPAALDAKSVMAVGTAGYTAALCVLALEDHGMKPAGGPIAVTGAAGGVGSVAIALLARRGFEVAAVTGRPEESDYLKHLGAREVLPRAEFAADPRPLGKERFQGAIDAAGSKVLANVLGMTKYGGVVAACGLAAGMDLPASVAPFILRGVVLVGIESVYASPVVRERAWDLLARDLDRGKLAAMTREIDLDAVPTAAKDILAGKVRGRLVVKVA